MLTSKPPIHLLVLAIPVAVILLFRANHGQWLNVASWTFFAAALALLLIAGRLAPKSQLFDERRLERRIATLLLGFEAIIDAFAVLLATVSPAFGILISAVAMAWILLWSMPQFRQLRFESSYVVRRSPEVVFAFISDDRNAPQWRAEVQSVEMLTPEPIGQGSRFRARVLFPDGLEYLGEQEIVEYEPNHRLAVRVTSGLRPNLDEKVFEAEGDGTRVTHRYDHELNMSLAALGGRFREPSARRLLMESRTAGQLRLTQILESGA